MAGRLLRHERGWWLVLLLAAMVAVAGRALAATGWAEGLDSVLWAALGGLLTGTLLGWSVFPGPLSHALSAVYGIAWLGICWDAACPAPCSGASASSRWPAVWSIGSSRPPGVAVGTTH